MSLSAVFTGASSSEQQLFPDAPEHLGRLDTDSERALDKDNAAEGRDP
jgi:hypothetical protein